MNPYIDMYGVKRSRAMRTRSTVAPRQLSRTALLNSDFEQRPRTHTEAGAPRRLLGAPRRFVGAPRRILGPGASWERPGASWDPLGSARAPLGSDQAPLGSAQAPLGSARAPLGSAQGASWERPGASWERTGASWERPGASWERPGASWAPKWLRAHRCSVFDQHMLSRRVPWHPRLPKPRAKLLNRYTSVNPCIQCTE